MTTAVIRTRSALNWLLDTSGFMQRIVDRHSIPIAIVTKDYSHKNAVHDFAFYCLAKSTKTLIAINHLIELRLVEDAQILIRSAYENYLAISFSSCHTERIDDFVRKKVGLAVGFFTHPETTSGKKDRRRIIDRRTGAELPFGISTGELAAGTRYPEDRAVHWGLYGFLSEHCHPHMMASGNYRNGPQTRYSYKTKGRGHSAIILAAYVYMLLIDELRFQNVPSSVLESCECLLCNGRHVLKDAFDIGPTDSTEYQYDQIPSKMKIRLEAIRLSCPGS